VNKTVGRHSAHLFSLPPASRECLLALRFKFPFTGFRVGLFQATMSASIHPAESSSDVEWLSRDSCNSFCERRRDQIRRDAEGLELVRDELMRAQKETIVRGLCTLNKDVKQLTVREFNATFGCDVIDMIREQMAAGDVQSSAGTKRFRALNMKTPAADKMSKPPTTIRTARRGEVVKSL
jgi:hypothetical protein